MVATATYSGLRKGVAARATEVCFCRAFVSNATALALKASSFAKCMTGSGPEQEPKGMVGKPARPARLPSRPLANAFGVAQRRLVLVLGGQPDRGQERGGASLRERGNGRAPLFNPPRRITLLTFHPAAARGSLLCGWSICLAPASLENSPAPKAFGAGLFSGKATLTVLYR